MFGLATCYILMALADFDRHYDEKINTWQPTSQNLLDPFRWIIIHSFLFFLRYYGFIQLIGLTIPFTLLNYRLKYFFVRIDWSIYRTLYCKWKNSLLEIAELLRSNRSDIFFYVDYFIFVNVSRNERQNELRLNIPFICILAKCLPIFFISSDNSFIINQLVWLIVRRGEFHFAIV